jgi:uncharacterized transporter YbjL
MSSEETLKSSSKIDEELPTIDVIDETIKKKQKKEKKQKAKEEKKPKKTQKEIEEEKIKAKMLAIKENPEVINDLCQENINLMKRNGILVSRIKRLELEKEIYIQEMKGLIGKYRDQFKFTFDDEAEELEKLN